MIACQETAFDCPGYLGTPNPLVTTYRNFDNTLPFLGRFHHHLHRPAIGLVFHPERLESGLGNGAKRADIRQGDSVEEPHQAGDHAVPYALLWRQATMIVLSERPRAQDEVSLTMQNRLQHPRQFRRIVTPITIKEYQNIGLACGACPGQAGRAISPSWFLNHRGSSSLCHCGGAIAAPVINNNHLMDECTGDGPDNTSNSGFFIQRWDNRYNTHRVSFQCTHHDSTTRLLHPA